MEGEEGRTGREGQTARERDARREEAEFDRTPQGRLIAELKTTVAALTARVQKLEAENLPAKVRELEAAKIPPPTKSNQFLGAPRGVWQPVDSAAC